ncbi:Nucleotide-binding alpha-beta plait [Penicillium hispanicum]|uniref:Nucleotide-binding alpha-beta plait n=1 Tax=Penicillium hispanicum TaxID=1080232 RepID=UPI00253F739C|nr:Nucleotide-binding alpha-beta plait [Penicillium hispanicum]KAJ5573391.1 Nucleotide-binding alpha-beta plait [Penicillium hispanicum]
MPFLGREKGRSPRSRRSDDEFVVFLQGIPAHCRWQELKDLVRQTALHIRQAVVYDDSHGFPTGLGQIIVKNEDEAWRTYHRLSTNGWEGQSLVVTLARTSAPTKPIAGPTRSPPAVAQGYISGHSTPQSKGSGTMPPSPISPESIQSASPTYPYPKYAPMMGPMPMPPQQFMPMMPDPLAQPMQCFPPSPLMHCAMFDAPGWNMMPLYPLSPTQSLHESGGDGYPHYQPRKPWASPAESNSPTSNLAQRAVYIQNLNAITTAADLKSLLQGAGTVEKCNVTVTSDTYDHQAQAHASAIMLTAEEAKRAVSMLNNMTFMGAQIRVKIDRRPSVTRSDSWDGTMAQEDHELPELVCNDKSSECSECGQNMLHKKTVDSCQPLVVDGSGLQKRSLEMLSSSAPT